MKRKMVHWADDSMFEQIKNALRERDLTKAAEILKTLSVEEARDVIRQDEGKIVVIAIKSAYSMMRDHNYNVEEFKELFSVFLSLDAEGLERGILLATSQIIKKSFVKISPELSVIFNHIDEVSKKESTSKKGVDDVVKTKDDSSLTSADNDTGSGASLEKKSKTQNASTETVDNLSNTCSEKTTINDFSSPEFINKKINCKTTEKENGNAYSFSSAILNFFFGWLNDLPHEIRESIEQNDSFLALQKHCKEVQEMLEDSMREIFTISENGSSLSNSGNYHVDHQDTANVRHDLDNSLIYTDNVLNTSALVDIPIMMFSGAHHAVFDHGEMSFF